MAAERTGASVLWNRTCTEKALIPPPKVIAVVVVMRFPDENAWTALEN